MQLHKCVYVVHIDITYHLAIISKLPFLFVYVLHRYCIAHFFVSEIFVCF